MKKKVRSVLIVHVVQFTTAFITIIALCGCATTVNDITRWEQSGNVQKLSEAARDKAEKPFIRKKSLESLARLNWKPTNEERVQVYSLFASKNSYEEAVSLMQTVTPEQFSDIDNKVVDAGRLLNSSGEWSDSSKARRLYNELLAMNSKAVTIALCQQVVAHPELQTRLVLFAIKLGLKGSEDDLVAVIFVYGDKSMAEDYLNSGSSTLADGAERWATAHRYRVSRGRGSARAGWGRF